MVKFYIIIGQTVNVNKLKEVLFVLIIFLKNEQIEKVRCLGNFY